MAFAGFDQIPLTPMRAHDSGIRVAVRPKQQMRDLMGDDIAKQQAQGHIESRVQFLHSLEKHVAVAATPVF
jgi:hypothetical protein